MGGARGQESPQRSKRKSSRRRRFRDSSRWHCLPNYLLRLWCRGFGADPPLITDFCGPNTSKSSLDSPNKFPEDTSPMVVGHPPGHLLSRTSVGGTFGIPRQSLLALERSQVKSARPRAPGSARSVIRWDMDCRAHAVAGEELRKNAVLPNTLNGISSGQAQLWSSPVLSSRLLWRHVEPVRVQIRSVDRAHLGSGPKEAGRSNIGGIVSAADVGLVHVAQARDRWRKRREGSCALGTLESNGN